jgi:hypothetical protein
LQASPAGRACGSATIHWNVGRSPRKSGKLALGGGDVGEPPGVARLLQRVEVEADDVARRDETRIHATAWYYPDEPDLKGITGETLHFPRRAKALLT